MKLNVTDDPEKTVVHFNPDSPEDKAALRALLKAAWDSIPDDSMDAIFTVISMTSQVELQLFNLLKRPPEHLDLVAVLANPSHPMHRPVFMSAASSLLTIGFLRKSIMRNLRQTKPAAFPPEDHKSESTGP